MDYVPDTLVRDGIPFGVVLQKFYFKSDIALLEQRLQQAKFYGSAAAEEWLKGISSEGKAAQSDAARFQQWESQGQLQALRQALDYRANAKQAMPKHRATVHALPARPPTNDIAYSPPPGASALTFSTLPPMPSHGLAPGLVSSHNPAPIQSDSMSIDSQRSTGTNKASKSSRERARIRSHKKADIVERCRRLIPPITKEQLEDLDAFDDALKIPIPLNENSWITLRDSLLHQRRKAILEDEARNAVRTAPVPGIFTPSTHSDDFLLAHAGTPKREKLCKIAEDFIRQKWGYGGFVTYPTSPQFAAEVLIHTRRAYEGDRTRTSSIQASSASGFIPLPAAQESSLKLEDMKWVFDQTIKPRTEQIRKDLFVCPECPPLGSVKYFAFESIIQHYASKHTNSFSRGTQMVNWKADWPISPPFSEHPERIVTPTPSITHTPTLTNVLLSTASSGSVLTSTIPSAGWHTPDDMSLASSTSRTYSITGPSAVIHNNAAKAPGPAMYEAQREHLSLALLRSTSTIQATPCMPVSLRLYLTIALALAQFKEKWSNMPGLALLRDCLQAKRDLAPMRDAENLRCAECAATKEHGSRARWSLSDLIVHFQSVHLDQCPTDLKPDWRNDMILLPEPELIRYEQSDPAVPEFMKECFTDAVTTATIQFTNTTIPKLPQMRKVESEIYHPHDVVLNESVPTSQNLRFQADYDEHELHRNAVRVRSRGGRTRIEPSTAATYSDPSVTRDALSVSLPSTVYENAWHHRRLHSPGYSRSPQRHFSRQVQPSQSTGGRQDDGEQIILPQAESMTRTNTVRSYKGRDESRTTTADDFLSTIDAYVDTEMADPQHHHDTGEHTARTAPPYGHSFITQPISFETSTRYVYEPRMGVEYSSTDGGRTMRREPSRVVEFDQDGTPVSYAGQVYQEISPRRRIIRQDIDAQPYEVTQIASTDSRVPWRRDSNHATGVDDTSWRRTQLAHPNRRVEYIAEPMRHTQHPHDAESSHWYMETSAPIGRYVEIDESDHRTLSARESSDQLSYYQDTDLQERTLGIGRYPPRFSGYEERTYYRQ